MKVTVKNKYLNVRVDKPSVNAPCYQYLAPGSELEVDGTLYKGDLYENADTWYKDEAGNYYWSGGVNEISAVNLENGGKWWLNNYKIPELWNMGLTGKGVKIAVLDTGISYPHPDLILNQKFLYDVTNSPSGYQDKEGHGTHCTGIIKASYNGIGPTGIAYNADVYTCKITHDKAGDDSSYLADALAWAITQQVDIISISKGSAIDDKSVETQIKVAKSKGILIVAAAGNIVSGYPHDHIYYPARYDGVLSVGGVDENNLVLSDSILTGETKIFAPGKNILSTYLNSGYCSLTGSSQATPFVAGVCALLLENKRKNEPSFKAIDIQNTLLSKADSLVQIKIINPKNSI